MTILDVLMEETRPEPGAKGWELHSRGRCEENNQCDIPLLSFRPCAAVTGRWELSWASRSPDRGLPTFLNAVVVTIGTTTENSADGKPP